MGAMPSVTSPTPRGGAADSNSCVTSNKPCPQKANGHRHRARAAYYTSPSVVPS